MSELLEFLAGDDGVEATDLVILPVFVYTSVREAVILVTLELVHGVIHPGTVEHVQAEQQLEILLDPFCLLLDEIKHGVHLTFVGENLAMIFDTFLRFDLLSGH